MGIDIIRKAAPSFRKALDRLRIKLGTPTLFTQQPIGTPLAYAAKLRLDKTVALGEKLGVRLDGQLVPATRGLDHVATFSNPTPELKEALKASHGEACGVVQTVHTIAGVAEITVCCPPYRERNNPRATFVASADSGTTRSATLPP
jgi:hypothetical protein